MSRYAASNRNQRGSSYDRRARRAWLVSPAAGFGGDGEKVPCWECGKMLTVDQVTPDRLIPGSQGGTYRRSNIRGPHCVTCSCRQGARLTNQLRRANDPYTDNDLCLTCGAHFLASHADGCAVGQAEASAAW